MKKSHGEVTLTKLMVISESQAHFKTLIVGHKKLIYLVKKDCIDNLKMYMLLLPYRLEQQRISCEFNWVNALKFSMLKTQSLYALEYLRKTLFLLNCKLT